MARFAAGADGSLARCRWLAIAVAAVVAGCGSSETIRLELRRVVPAADAICGAPADARTLLVTALGAFPPTEATADSRTVADGVSFDITSFPPETRVLGVQVIGTGGAVRTVGQTAPFDLEALADGDVLPVFMAPPRGFCPSGPPAAPRIAPLAARVGGDVLVLGGQDESGAPVAGVERYHHDTGSFRSVTVDLYADDALGLIGATATAISGERVVIAGGSRTAFQVYDGATDTVDGARFLPQARAHHAAVWLGGGRVLLVGGCARLEVDGTCDPSSVLATTTIIDVDGEQVTDGPFLGRPRTGASAVREADGRVLVVGGVSDDGDPVTIGERIDPERIRGREDVVGASGIAVALDGGSALASFASPVNVAVAAASVIPGGATTATPVSPGPMARSGASATRLEDGRVLVVGGLEADAGDEALYYVPSEAGFEVLTAAPRTTSGVLRRRDHAAVRLADGAVLLVGGRDSAGAALADAWVFRPDLIGPFSTDVTVSFGDPALAQQVVPRDPGRVRVDTTSGPPSRLVITSSGSDEPSEWVVLAGPTFSRSTISVRARAVSGGLAVLLWFEDASNYAAVTLTPDQTPRLHRVVGGDSAAAEDCTGQPVSAAVLRDGFAELVVAAEPGTVRVDVAGVTALSCAGLDPQSPGLVGVGVLGGDGAEVEVSSVSVRR